MNRLLITLILAANSLQTLSLSYSNYAELKASKTDLSISVLSSHLDAISTSFQVYEKISRQAHNRSLLCIPNGVHLTPIVVEQFIQQAALKFTKEKSASLNLSQLAFTGISMNYPCEYLLSR
jgi:hypothetical protein